MPFLPVIGDPAIFLALYQTKIQVSSSDDSKRNLLRFAYPPEFRVLTYSGDLLLGLHSLSILFDIFGRQNRMIIQSIYADWTSNASWQELAMFYRLDEYVGWIPKTLHEGGKSKKRDKTWADIWEAWWACCFSEREVWGDDIDDLLCILRRIIELKYWGLVERYSATGEFIRSNSSFHGYTNVDESEKIEVQVREVWTDDDDIHEWINQHSRADKREFLGHCATIGSEISCYAEDREDAISNVVYSHKYGHKGTYSPPTLLLMLYKPRKRESLHLFIILQTKQEMPSDRAHSLHLWKHVLTIINHCQSPIILSPFFIKSNKSVKKLYISEHAPQKI